MSLPEITELLRIKVPAFLVDRIEIALEMLAESHSCWQPVGSDQIVYEVYFETHEDADRASNALTMQLMAWADAKDWSINLESVPATDWSNSWKAFFHVERVSNRIVTKPTWESYTPEPGDCVIEMDPGMSFGTGQHATTRACLRFLDTLTASGKVMSVLDLGCGSGILSIAAAKLGCTPVFAIDIDADSVRIAIENIAANGCDDTTTAIIGDVAELGSEKRYHIVAANILAPVLIEHAAKIAGCVSKNDGYLLLAGILTTQYPSVRDAYLPFGFDEIEIATDGEWTAGKLRRKVDVITSV